MKTAGDQTEELDGAAGAGRGSAGPPEDEAPGRLVLGRHRLLRRLGAGGFGVVWLAHDERLDRVVAVKRIPVHDAAAGTRAEREARAAARLAHPGIVALYESGRDDEAVYLVSELVRGRTLGALMADGALSDRDVLRVGVALCDALRHAHGRGVVHRDVKPGNVMVPDAPHDAAGVAKLTDFGVARIAGDDVLTRTGDVVGTLAYMAPEQADGREAGPEADLYALGLVVYEALAGVNPVRGRGAASTARRVGARLPALGRLRRDLALDLCRAIDRAVLPRPEHRGTLADLRAALAAALPGVDDEPGTIAGSPLERLADGAAPRPAIGRRRRLAAGAAAGALVTGAVAWLGPPPLHPVACGAAAAALVAVLPRAAWLALAGALVVWLASTGRGGVAAVVAAAVLPTALLLRRGGLLWSAPALAPVLGLAGLAGAWPALAGQAARPWHRAALGALGGWWLALAEPLAHEHLALGAPRAAVGAASWEPAAGRAIVHVLVPVVMEGALIVAALWAIAALAVPLVVRGRRLAVDLVGATAWAAALGCASRAVVPEMRGLVAGAVAAGALAVAARASRGEARSRPAS